MAPAEAEPTSKRSRRRAIAVAVVMVAWLSIQLVVPAMRLVERGGAARPRTFGWQMFSHQLEGPAEEFTITTANGRRVIAVDRLLTGPMRREILYAPTIVAELCTDPAIISVAVRDAEWGTSEVSCR